MDLSHAARLVSLYRRGLVTPSETVSGLLIGLVRSDDRVAPISAWLHNSPDELRWEFEGLLRHIQLADYQWRPFVFGPGGPIRESAAADMARLRQICQEWSIAQSPEPSVAG